MLITTTDEWASALDAIKNGHYFYGLDLETTGLQPFKGHRMIGVALLACENVEMLEADPLSANIQSFYAPFRHKVGNNLPFRTLKWLAPILADPARRLTNHNLKFDAQFCYVDGMPVHNGHADSMLAAHFANENELLFNLDFLSKRHVGHDAGKFEEQLFAYAKANWGGRITMKMIKSRMAEIPPEYMWEYAEQDVIAAWKLFWNRMQSIAEDGLWDMFWEIMDYSQIGLRMEEHGVLVDPEACMEIKRHCQQRKAELYQQMVEIVGYEFNPNSSPQMQKIFGLPSVTKEIMANLDPQEYPLVEPLGEWRQWDRQETSYMDAYLERRDHHDRVHTDLSLTGTISGRLSSKQPNMQALPRGTEIYRVRDVIVAPPGKTLVSFDYSQIELRFTAFYTQDPSLLKAYQGGEDIHTQTAEATGLDRDAAPGAKTLNFSSVYGIGEEGIMRKFKKTQREAADLLRKFNNKYPNISRLRRDCERLAKRQKYIEMWTGRRRRYGFGVETHKAMSNLIQGGVAEVMRVAILRLDEFLEPLNARMVLQVHDDILFEVDNELVPWILPHIKNIMEDFDFSINGDPATRVPIIAEGKFGQTWLSMKKWKPDPETCEHDYWRWDVCVACGCTPEFAQEQAVRREAEAAELAKQPKSKRAAKPAEDPFADWGDNLLDDNQVPSESTQSVYYWVHPESDCVFITNTDEHPGDLCESITREEYEQCLAKHPPDTTSPAATAHAGAAR